METSDLWPSQTEIVGNLGAYYLQLASETGRQSYETEPLTCGLCCYLQQIVSELTSSCNRELLGVGKPHTFGDQKCRSVVSVRIKDKPRRNTGCFSLYRAVVGQHSWYQTWKIKVSSRVLGIKLASVSEFSILDPRNKPTHIWPTDLQQRCQEYTWGKDSLFNKWYGKTGYSHAKKEIKPLFHIHHSQK